MSGKRKPGDLYEVDGRRYEYQKMNPFKSVQLFVHSLELADAPEEGAALLIIAAFISEYLRGMGREGEASPTKDIIQDMKVLLDTIVESESFEPFMKEVGERFLKAGEQMMDRLMEIQSAVAEEEPKLLN